MEQDIREYALEIGFDSIGFTTVDPFIQLREALEERKNDYSWVTDGLLQLANAADPRYALPAARSVIVLIYDYYKQAYPAQLAGRIGKIYQSRLYPGKTRLFGSRLRLIREFLEARGMEVGFRPAMAERQAAARAGVGCFGCNTFIYQPGKGSYVGIFSLAVSAELEPTTAVAESQCPDDCRRCIAACPTGALYVRYRMNPLHCIAFNTYGAGNFPGTPEDIPREIREKMGSWIYGCDLCQDACPRNHKRLQQILVPDAYLEEMAPRLAPGVLLTMDDQYFQETVQQLLYGYIWDKKFIQRNAAIALGNSDDEGAASLLVAAMEDPQEMVRQYSAWALGRIGGKSSRKALEMNMKKEKSGKVKAEIVYALDSL